MPRYTIMASANASSVYTNARLETFRRRFYANTNRDNRVNFTTAAQADARMGT